MVQRPQPPPTLSQSKPSKRKRDAEQSNPPFQKRPRISCPIPSIQTLLPHEAVNTPQKDIDLVRYRIQENRWPREYFESGKMSHILARQKSTASLRRKRSETGSDAPSSTTPSDQKPREEKSAAYQHARYETLLATTDRLLIESVNEGWNNSIPLTKPRPQPDYSVGFRREAFTNVQLQKLQPFVGELTENSFFMATYYMYFPFFSSEVECGAAALDVADRQNAHSMTLAVRGVVELFTLVKREKELHREILAFSISHDHRSVRIYGHYPVIEGDKTIFYRHPIRDFSFTELDGREKWTAYKFTKNVYDTWMPAHFKRFCVAIDDIPPNIHFELSDEPDLQFSPSSGLSQSLQIHHLSESMVAADDGFRLLDSQELTPDTSITQTSEQVNFKKPKKK